MALEAAKALPARAMRPAEAIGLIEKARGVSGYLGRVRNEVRMLGLREEFGNRKSVKRKELVDYIRLNRLFLSEAFSTIDPDNPPETGKRPWVAFRKGAPFGMFFASEKEARAWLGPDREGEVMPSRFIPRSLLTSPRHRAWRRRGEM